ncbi:hypothetical protein B1A99_00550 [Cohnella sp. CIP 111063]|uniref:hypothetical protein n=1 Tax=unclassified Cohnella TaxID=2636738 RepID=UPI000B8C4BCF|nr:MULTISPECIES: hypothetical protein [unclassified Cohnella]OXS62393.1 hypothetical protein B1A99_00550 [Cohnella sp. CIP 111063]PRX74628.1 hypothetical protein B0G52_101113 [Cohnella sp. SGD-V74]
MNNNSEDEQLAKLRDIQIARLAFIGASIATIGDGISTYAAALALEVLEEANNQRSQPSSSHFKNLDIAQKQLDYYIQQLQHMRQWIK